MDSCYSCEGTDFILRKGEVRDAPAINILECNDCGIVSLDSIAHVEKR